MNAETESHPTACGGTPVSLAGSGVGRVVACSCGNVHVDVDYVTLRFAPEAFAELAAMLARAQCRLAGEHASHADPAEIAALH